MLALRRFLTVYQGETRLMVTFRGLDRASGWVCGRILACS